MHEVLIAKDVFETVQGIAREKNAKIKKIVLEIGELSLVNPEQLKFWIEIYFEKPILMEIKNIKGKIECLDCDYKGEISKVLDNVFHYSIPILYCKKCGGNNVRILEGKDLRIRNVELEIERHEKEGKDFDKC
ncbi:MAG: hydrogenase maturation nickel metallochaperone HypA [Candidatus Methanofastidiosia archaeon]